MYMNDSDWGVIQKFELEADTYTALKAACMIALTDHSTAYGWRVAQEIGQPPCLFITWTDKAPENNKFMVPIKDANALAKMIWDWLHDGNFMVYNNAERHDTDGDLKEGFSFTMGGKHFSDMFFVKPEYIIYGK